MVNVYFDPDMVGGVEWYIKDISSYLVQMGHEVLVLASSSHDKSAVSSAEGESGAGRGRPDGPEVRHIPILLGPTYRTRVWPSLLSALRGCEADIIHCFDYMQFQTLATMLSPGPNSAGLVGLSPSSTSST